jgi:hypothetical protein
MNKQDSWKKWQEIVREHFASQHTRKFFQRGVAKAIDQFALIQARDFKLFKEKSEERGTEFQSDGLVGCYLAIREIFVRLHFLLWKPFAQKGEQFVLSANDKKVLHNLLQDLRVTSSIGQIDLESDNIVGSKDFLENVVKGIYKQGRRRR